MTLVLNSIGLSLAVGTKFCGKIFGHAQFLAVKLCLSLFFYFWRLVAKRMRMRFEAFLLLQLIFRHFAAFLSRSSLLYGVQKYSKCLNVRNKATRMGCLQRVQPKIDLES